MENTILNIQERATLGKKVCVLRRAGITPANIYGSGIESQAIQFDTVDAEHLLAKTGGHHIIILKSPGSEKPRNVLIKKVQRHILTQRLIHIDFQQIRMTDKVKVMIPIVFQGESPASQRKDLLFLENLSAIEVECLPNAIPDRIEADISVLAEAGDHLLVSDLTMGEGVTVAGNLEDIVASVGHTRVTEGVVEEGDVEAGGAAGTNVAASGEEKNP